MNKCGPPRFYLFIFSADANTLQILHRRQKRLNIWGERSRTNILHLFVIQLCHKLINYFDWSCTVTQKLTNRAHFKAEYEHFSRGFDPLNMCVGQILNDNGLETVVVEFTWDVFAQLVYLTNTHIFFKNTSVIPLDMSVSMCGLSFLLSVMLFNIFTFILQSSKTQTKQLDGRSENIWVYFVSILFYSQIWGILLLWNFSEVIVACCLTNVSHRQLSSCSGMKKEVEFFNIMQRGTIQYNTTHYKMMQGRRMQHHTSDINMKYYFRYFMWFVNGQKAR